MDKSVTTLNNSRYQIEKLFSDSGGMGLIYSAVDRRNLNNRVLLKCLRYDRNSINYFDYGLQEATAFVEKTRKMLEWEKKVLVRFKNEGMDNIPNINDYFYDRSITLKSPMQSRFGEYHFPAAVLAQEPFLVMERIAGENLEKILAEPRFQARKEVVTLKLAKEITTLFIKFHKRFLLNGVSAYFIFQDLKPGNILVSNEDYFTLIDFGGITLKLGEMTTEPTAGVITRGYCGPEAGNSNETKIDHRFDIYTLGATMYHILTGIDPRELTDFFPVLDLQALKKAHLNPKTIALVGKALKRNPDERYQNAAEMRKDIGSLLTELDAV